MSTETKIITKQAETFEIVEKAVNKLVNLASPTFGPSSHKIIIDKFTHKEVVDDGVQVARDCELEDPMENAVVKIIKETAIKTSDRVGDGTTGSLIILQAIINEIGRKSRINGRKIELELKAGFEEVKEQLLLNSKTIKTKDEIKKVAMVSYDNEKVADILSDLYSKLGKDAVITVEKSQTGETHCEMAGGTEIERGYISPYMVLDGNKMETVLENPYILLTDYRLMEINDIMPIMEKLCAKDVNKRSLVVICENMEQSALATAVANIIQNKFFLIAITAPFKDNKRKEYMEDLALLTGGKLFTESKGNKIENAEIKDLGKASKFICRQNESIIVKPKGDKANIKFSIEALESAIKNEPIESKRTELEHRLARFTDKIAVLKVGAPTENELKSVLKKATNAVNSVKSALKSGVVCGSGLELAHIKTHSPILNEALKYPLIQLYENMGMDVLDMIKSDVFNVVTHEHGDFMKVGVVDPTEVLITACESAVSIASVLVTSSGIIVEKQKDAS